MPEKTGKLSQVWKVQQRCQSILTYFSASKTKSTSHTRIKPEILSTTRTPPEPKPNSKSPGRLTTLQPTNWCFKNLKILKAIYFLNCENDVTSLFYFFLETFIFFCAILFTIYKVRTDKFILTRQNPQSSKKAYPNFKKWLETAKFY